MSEGTQNLPTPPPPGDMSQEADEWHLLRQGMAMTFDQKLEWLEDIHRIAREFESSRLEKSKANSSEAVAEDPPPYRQDKS